ncbi:glycerol-3-phosphate 1-O-acyltransferase PlsY [Candidatus Aerophobetes bacterium]|nr:glycerol-3-phosphate 1-O-acyltransferase PlsY [Candidatus Aerophobetes bacterium]
MLLWLVIILISGYLIGSIPGGYIVGRLARGVDVRKYGSRNIGTTNVLRVLGKRFALYVFLIDFGKGVASVSLAYFFSIGIDSSVARALAGIACIAGHSWPLFLKFRGGKGVATSAGVFASLTPLPFLFSLVTMIAVVAVTRYVSLGSMISAALLPFYIWILMGSRNPSYIYLGIATAGLIILRHHSNLKRLFAGRENKLGERVKITKND